MVGSSINARQNFNGAILHNYVEMSSHRKNGGNVVQKTICVKGRVRLNLIRQESCGQVIAFELR
jgi:hypothetical protein